MKKPLSADELRKIFTDDYIASCLPESILKKSIDKIFMETRKFYFHLGEYLEGRGEIVNGMDMMKKSLYLNELWSDVSPYRASNVRFIYSYDDIHKWLRAIGHLSAELDILLKMTSLGWKPEYNYVIIAPEYAEIANKALLNYWGKYCTIVSDQDFINKLLPIIKYCEAWEVSTSYYLLKNNEVRNCSPAHAAVQEAWESENRKPLLELTPDDYARGWALLKEHCGICEGDWFVCMHARESGFYNDAENLNASWRNVDINDFIPAVKTITDRGGHVIRNGEKTAKQMPEIKGLFDYARSDWKSDWMELFLMSQCSFFMGSSSGPVDLSLAFGRPSVIVGAPIYVRGYSKNDIFIPKLYFYKDKPDELIGFKESLSPAYWNKDSLYQRGIRVRDNTPEEITEVVIEMLERISEKVTYDKVDDELQQKFNEYAPVNRMNLNSRIGRDFINRWKHLL